MMGVRAVAKDLVVGRVTFRENAVHAIDIAKAVQKAGEQRAARRPQPQLQQTAEAQPKPVASLEPGKLYVIKGRFKTIEAREEFRADLLRQAPECRFLILDPGCELMSTIPVTEDAPNA